MTSRDRTYSLEVSLLDLTKVIRLADPFFFIKSWLRVMPDLNHFGTYFNFETTCADSVTGSRIFTLTVEPVKDPDFALIHRRGILHFFLFFFKITIFLR